MSTLVPKDALRTLIASFAGLPEDVVIWDGEPKPPVAPAQDARRIILNVVARRRIGHDSSKRTYPDANTIVTTYKGQRILTVSVKAENFGAEEGFDLLESVRMQLDQADTAPSLNALSLSVNETGDVRTLNASAGNRKASFATFDVRFNQGVSRVVTSAASGTNPSYIESVELGGEDDLAGADVTIDAPP